jgi:hypothetical protein
MDLFNELPLGRKIILICSILLLIDTFFAWQSYTYHFGGLGSGTVTRNAWHGFWGVLLGLLTIAVVGWTIARMLKVDLPAPDGMTSLTAGIILFVFALLKMLTDNYRGWASYVGVLLAAAIAYGGWMIFKASGESLPSMPASSRGAAAGGAAGEGGGAAAAAAPPPAAEPAPPAADEPAGDETA